MQNLLEIERLSRISWTINQNNFTMRQTIPFRANQILNDYEKWTIIQRTIIQKKTTNPPYYVWLFLLGAPIYSPTGCHIRIKEPGWGHLNSGDFQWPLSPFFIITSKYNSIMAYISLFE